MKEKVVVITGASGGIGAALARVVAARGGIPVLAARREAELAAVAAECGPRALAVPTDATRRAEVERLRDAALAKFDRIDVWVNNAGRGITRSVASLTDEDLDDMMLVNVKSALYGMQAALVPFRQRGEGHIINVSSVLGRVPYASFRSAYSAAKHALNSLTANLRVDLRASHPGIHISSVFPGPVSTDFGLNSVHGGVDSRKIPNSQPVEEVAAIIADLIERPRAEVYTRPQYHQQVVRYYTADDIAEVESQPPFVPSRG